MATPADLPSQYFDILQHAYPDGLHYTGGFELNQPTQDPKLDIEVIVVTSATNAPSTKTICERFATDFGFSYLNIGDYLQYLADQDLEPLHPALALVHPSALNGMVDEGRQPHPSFLIPMLRYKLECGMAENDCKRCLISGFDGGQAVMLFAMKVSPRRSLVLIAPLISSDRSSRGLGQLGQHET